MAAQIILICGQYIVTVFLGVWLATLKNAGKIEKIKLENII
jgi:hypothetical protein